MVYTLQRCSTFVKRIVMCWRFENRKIHFWKISQKWKLLEAKSCQRFRSPGPKLIPHYACNVEQSKYSVIHDDLTAQYARQLVTNFVESKLEVARMSELLSCRRIGDFSVEHSLSLTITNTFLSFAQITSKTWNFSKKSFLLFSKIHLKDLCLKDLSLCVPHFKPKTSLQWFVSKKTLKKVSQPARCAMDSAEDSQHVNLSVASNLKSLFAIHSVNTNVTRRLFSNHPIYPRQTSTSKRILFLVLQPQIGVFHNFSSLCCGK